MPNKRLSAQDSDVFNAFAAIATTGVPPNSDGISSETGGSANMYSESAYIASQSQSVRTAPRDESS